MTQRQILPSRLNKLNYKKLLYLIKSYIYMSYSGNSKEQVVLNAVTNDQFSILNDHKQKKPF